MTTKTRYFVIVSLLVLTVGLGTGLLAYYVGFPPVASQGQGLAELRLVPPNASLVAFAEVRQIMASPLRQKLSSILPLHATDRQGFQAQTGINVETDIDHVVASLVESPDPTTGRGSAFVIARGRFDVVKIEALMRDHGGRPDQYKGRRVIDGGPNPDAPTLSLAFVEPGLIAAGSASLVRSAIDRADGGPNVTSNNELMNLVRDQTGNAWAAGRFDALAARAHLPATVSGQLPAIAWFSAGATIDTGIGGTIRAEASDEQAAANLRDVVRGMISLAKLQSSSYPQMQQVLNSFQIGGSGKTVTLAFDVPGTVIDALANGFSQAAPSRLR